MSNHLEVQAMPKVSDVDKGALVSHQSLNDLLLSDTMFKVDFNKVFANARDIASSEFTKKLLQDVQAGSAEADKFPDLSKEVSDSPEEIKQRQKNAERVADLVGDGRSLGTNDVQRAQIEKMFADAEAKGGDAPQKLVDAINKELEARGSKERVSYTAPKGPEANPLDREPGKVQGRIQLRDDKHRLDDEIHNKPATPVNPRFGTPAVPALELFGN